MLRVLPPEPLLRQIRLVTGLNVGGKMRNIAIQLVLQQCCKSSCTFFCTLNIVLAPFKFCTNSLLPTFSPPPPNLANRKLIDLANYTQNFVWIVPGWFIFQLSSDFILILDCMT